MTSRPHTDGSRGPTSNSPQPTPAPGDALTKHQAGGYDTPAQDAPFAEPTGNPTDTTSRPAGFDDRGRVKRSRFSAAWVGLIAAALALILLIVFIAQNLKNASIHFLGFSGQAPVGLMLLIAVVGGILLVAVPGSVRILQLRKALKANTPKEQRRV